MSPEAALMLLKRGNVLAAQIPARDLGRVGWVGVYPLDPQRAETGDILRRFGIAPLYNEEPLFRLRRFEVDRKLMGSDVCISEEDLFETEDYLAIGEEDLLRKMQSVGVDIGLLELPFKSEYPI